MTERSATGDLTLGHILASAGLDVGDVLVIRHTLTEGVLVAGFLTPDRMLAYTREQRLANKVGLNPPHHWLCFMAEGGRRCRLHSVFDNYGEVVAERNEVFRYFNLVHSTVLTSLVDRLVIERGKDTVNWAKTGMSAADFPVIKIADQASVPFPGFYDLALDRGDLLALFEDSRFESWHTAFGSVQGVYVIADKATGRLYVGKADGSDRVLGRWRQDAQNGHGDNIELERVLSIDPEYARHFRYSLLRVFCPSVDEKVVTRAEEHFETLLSREYGHYKN